MATLQLDWTDETGAVRSFMTSDALWDGADWNGCPAPQLPKWQSWLLALLIGEDAGPVPSTRTEAEGVEESDYVWVDGLTWSVIDAAVIEMRDTVAYQIGQYRG